MSGLILVDKSAYVRGGAIAELDGELCLCAATRLEVLYSARSGDDYMPLEDDLESFRDLRMDSETWAIALGASRELAGRGNHRVPIPDLLVASCAQQHGASVAHVDRHFATLAEILSFESLRVN